MLETMGMNEKDSTLDIMKIICALLVVIGHVVSVYTPFAYIQMPSDRLLLGVWKVIYSFHMPAFVAISGALFFHIKNRGGYSRESKFVVNKIKRLLVPYIVFCLFAVIPVMHYLGEDMSVSLIFNNYILAENPRHLWYLFMLFFVFIISNRMYGLIRNYSSLALFVVICIFYLGSFLPIRFQLYNISKYLLYFYLGGALYENRNLLKIKYNLYYMIGMMSLIFSVFFLLHEKTRMFGSQTGEMLLAMSGIILLYLCSKIISNTKISCFECLSKNSYGIYLFHPMLNYLIFAKGGCYFTNPYISCVIVSIINVVGSVFLTELCRKLHIKFIIGE